MSLGENVLVLVVYALAVMRITRLVNADKIMDKLRTYPAHKLQQSRLTMLEARAHGQTKRAEEFARKTLFWDKALYYVSCPWCVGMWVSLGTAWVPLYAASNPVAQYLAVALAVSHLVGVLARFADTEDIEIVDDEDSDD